MRLFRPLLGVVLVISLILNAILWARYRNQRMIMTVNGQSVTKRNMDDYLEQQFGPTYKAMIVQRMLIDQEAQKQGVSPSDTEVDEEFNNKRELDWQFANRIALSPMVAAESKNEIRQQLEQQRLLAKDITVTDEEIKDEYNTHPALYDTPAKATSLVAAVLNDAHTEEIRQMMARNDPPVNPAAVMQQFPREVVFIGDSNRFTFVQPYGSDMNRDIFTMEPNEVKVILPGDLAQQGARRLIVRLQSIQSGRKADLNDPKTLTKIKLNVALRRSKPLAELLAQLWASCKFVSEDPSDKALIERLFFPDRPRAEGASDKR